jgi:hypothetical protein
MSEDKIKWVPHAVLISRQKKFSILLPPVIETEGDDNILVFNLVMNEGEDYTVEKDKNISLDTNIDNITSVLELLNSSDDFAQFQMTLDNNLSNKDIKFEISLSNSLNDKIEKGELDEEKIFDIVEVAAQDIVDNFFDSMRSLIEQRSDDTDIN